MYELGDTAVTSAAANFTRSTTGNLANFITDVNRPGLLQIPAGVWTVDAYLSETGGGSNHAQIWVEVEKWDGSTITTIATSPIEQITNGNVIDLYTWAVSIPTTTLTVTDRIIIQFYITNTNGKTVTLYTQNGYVGEVHTTFTTGIGSLNGLTAPTQYFATGTSGTDFAISSSTATHTFNLPTASGSNRGALSSADWTTFNGKVGGSGTTNYVPKWTGSTALGNSQIFDNGTQIGIGTATPSASYPVTLYNPTSAFLVFNNNAGSNTFGGFRFQIAGNDRYTFAYDGNNGNFIVSRFNASGVYQGNNITAFNSTGNVVIAGSGSATDAGYRLDVNGTARVSGTALFTGNIGGNSWNFDSGNGRWVFGTSTNQLSRYFTLINIWSTTAATLAVRNIASQTANSLQIENSSSTVLSGFDVNGGLFVGSTSLNASAIIEATSTTKGFLPPRMTNAQMVAIATPAAGLVVYDTTNNKLNVYDGTNWVAVH
jgi:hypothetical protein